MAIKTEPFTINFGPQHPSTHGVFRMRLTLDGEVVVNLEPVYGYLHRGIEKLVEGRTYSQIIPVTDRLDYAASMSNNLAYVTAVEKLAGIPVPERAEYLRVIMVELQRIASHQLAVGAFTNDCGCFFTPFLYMWREREKIVDLFDMVCGQRLTSNRLVFCPGSWPLTLRPVGPCSGAAVWSGIFAGLTRTRSTTVLSLKYRPVPSATAMTVTGCGLRRCDRVSVSSSKPWNNCQAGR
jgi:hypothetical protein